MIAKAYLYSQEQLQDAFMAWQETFCIVDGIEDPETISIDKYLPRLAAWHAYVDARDSLAPGSTNRFWVKEQNERKRLEAMGSAHA